MLLGFNHTINNNVVYTYYIYIYIYVINFEEFYLNLSEL